MLPEITSKRFLYVSSPSICMLTTKTLREPLRAFEGYSKIQWVLWFVVPFIAMRERSGSHLRERSDAGKMVFIIDNDEYYRDETEGFICIRSHRERFKNSPFSVLPKLAPNGASSCSILAGRPRTPSERENVWLYAVRLAIIAQSCPLSSVSRIGWTAEPPVQDAPVGAFSRH